MHTLKGAWLYKKLTEIYGVDQIILRKHTWSSRTSYTPFPIRKNMLTIGWVGVSNHFLTPASINLIKTLVEHQEQFTTQKENKPEELWHLFIKNDPIEWTEQWWQLGYNLNTSFGNIYIYISSEYHSLLDIDLYSTLKETVSSLLETETFFYH